MPAARAGLPVKRAFGRRAKAAGRTVCCSPTVNASWHFRTKPSRRSTPHWWQRFLFTLEEAHLRRVRAESIAAAAIAAFAAANHYLAEGDVSQSA